MYSECVKMIYPLQNRVRKLVLALPCVCVLAQTSYSQILKQMYIKMPLQLELIKTIFKS